jgi:DNA repair photolyase
LPTVDPNYPDKFAKQLAKMKVSGAAYMTSFSEPFHYLEKTYHITERLTNLFVSEGLPIFYCTRHNPEEWAIEALQQNPYSYIQWSVNTSNARDYKKMSPGAAKLDDIFNMVADLSELGVYTSFQCNPIQAGVTTLDELLELVDICGEIGLDHIIFKFAEQVFNARQVIIDRLRQRRFDQKRIDAFDSMFNQVIGGVYTIQEDVRIEWLTALLERTRQAGISMSTCYEYYDDGKAGANLAPFFTTADQCHGRGVPVHFRSELGEPFQPLAGCYRKGCLYCADAGTQACNNETLLNAQALQYSDLRKIEIVSYEAGWDLEDSCARPDEARYHHATNPDLKTDAELWGWELYED